MLEGLAAATIYATNWDRTSPFVNPMCGSGTLAIEAALIATNRTPGLFRTNYAFMHIEGYDKMVYENERIRLDDQIKTFPNLKIFATDLSNKAIENAKKNATTAGVEDLIHFAVCDFAATQVPQNKQGVMMVNPEYGERLGDLQELEETYSRIGDFMKQQCGGYLGYVFTGNLDLAKKIGLKANALRKALSTFNLCSSNVNRHIIKIGSNKKTSLRIKEPVIATIQLKITPILINCGK